MMRMTASFAVPLVAGAAVLTAGCAASAGADPATSSSSSAPASSTSAKPSLPAKPGSIVGSVWRLKTDPTAWFRVQGSNIQGNDGCNALTGTATAPINSVDRVDFGAGVASTLKFCPDPKGTQTAIQEALKGERKWNRSGAEMLLIDTENNRTWTFVLSPAGSSSTVPSVTAAPPSRPAVTSSAARPNSAAPATSTAPAPR